MLLTICRKRVATRSNSKANDQIGQGQPASRMAKHPAQSANWAAKCASNNM